MAKLTIAQLREKEINRLVAYKTSDLTQADYDEARQIMNSFYRLCGLADRNLYLANDERTCNSAYTKANEDREMRWYERLRKRFEDTYGLTLFYTNWLPSIGKRYADTGAVEVCIYKYMYN